jgi:hypothetical protein
MKPLTFNKSIEQVLKQVHPDLSITDEATYEMNNFLNNLMDEIIKKSHHLHNLRHVIDDIFDGQLRSYAISEIMKIMKKHNLGVNTGLVFSYLELQKVFDDIELSLAVSTVLEYISAEILELAGNVARDDERLLLEYNDIITAMNNDPELVNLIEKIGFFNRTTPHNYLNMEHISNTNYLDLKLKPLAKSKTSKRSKFNRSKSPRSKRSKSRRSKVGKSRRSKRSKSRRSKVRKSRRSKVRKSRRSKVRKSRRSKGRKSRRSKVRKSRRSKVRKSRRSKVRKSRRSKLSN